MYSKVNCFERQSGYIFVDFWTIRNWRVPSPKEMTIFTFYAVWTVAAAGIKSSWSFTTYPHCFIGNCQSFNKKILPVDGFGDFKLEDLKFQTYYLRQLSQKSDFRKHDQTQKTVVYLCCVFEKRSAEGPVPRNERLMVLLQVWERARTEGEKRESLFLQRNNKTTC